MLVNFPVKTQFSAWCKLKSLDTKAHQIEGIDWIINRETSPTLGAPGGFLCDEMGLGKTILMIGAMVINPKAKTLLVLPKSLMDQWFGAIVKFTHMDKEDILMYHGANRFKNIDAYSMVITTYGMISTRKPTAKVPVYRCPLWSQKWDEPGRATFGGF